jgi:hypothetical protein
MAITSGFIASTGVLTTSGDDLDNTITTSRNAAGTILINGGAVPIVGGTPTVANTVVVQALGNGGNDTIAIDETNGALPRANLFGGLGNDTITGGSGADQLFGEVGNDTLFGRGGADMLNGSNGDDTLTGGAGDDQMFGEAGNDVFRWDPGDGSDTVEGGGGVDAMLFNGNAGAEIFEVSANGGRARFTRDLGNIVMDLDGVEIIDLNALGGSDTIAVNDLSATDLVEVDINLAGTIGGTTGDGQFDRVTTFGTNGNDTVAVFGAGTAVSVQGLAAAVNIANADATDQLAVSTLAGNDSITATTVPAGVMTLTIDAGAGGLGDFDHDADSDILLFQEAGGVKNLLTLEMENNAVQAARTIGQLGADWQIDRVADFDGDADQDILLHSDAGGLRSLLVLEMNGGAIAAGHVIGQLGTDWQIDGAGDFDRDGDSDILLHQDNGTTRNLLMFEMNGNAVQAAHSFGAMGTDFQIGAIGDFDHDGDADISVRHERAATTEVTVLEVNNDAIVAAHNAVNLGLDFFLV